MLIVDAQIHIWTGHKPTNANHRQVEPNRFAVGTRAAVDQIRDLGSRTPTAVIPAGREGVAELATEIAATLAMVKDSAHGALELWAQQVV